VLLVGGTSEIGLAIVRELAGREPREVMLAGRDSPELAAAAADLRDAPGVAAVHTATVDLLDTSTHAALVSETVERLDGLDVAIIAAGVLGARGGLPDDIDAELDLLRVNTVGAGSVLMRVAQYMRGQSAGQIVALSSVAAQRPRRALAVYGASKAGFDALAQALADDLRERGVRILVVRPGFVRTKMTAGLSAAPLATDPQAVAKVTADGLAGGAQTVWAPRALQLLMIVLTHIPRPIFRRLRA
jgi:decaprenylphospho-beta-D-erythro-pentofuranosid-2-ulose 2-reductase